MKIFFFLFFYLFEVFFFHVFLIQSIFFIKKGCSTSMDVQVLSDKLQFMQCMSLVRVHLPCSPLTVCAVTITSYEAHNACSSPVCTSYACLKQSAQVVPHTCLGLSFSLQMPSPLTEAGVFSHFLQTMPGAYFAPFDTIDRRLLTGHKTTQKQMHG